MRPPKAKRFPLPPRLAALLQSCPAILAVNWVFQGMRGMGRKELSFRLMIEAGLTIVVASGAVAWGWWPSAAVLAAFALAHTVNFTFNGQVWVCARYCRSWRGDAPALHRFAGTMTRRLQSMPWLDEALVIGSLGGGSASDARSDLDLRLIFPVGARAWLRTNLLLLELRARAFLTGVPLDLYAYDSPSSLKRFDPHEPWVVLVDRLGRLRSGYPEHLPASLPQHVQGLA